MTLALRDTLTRAIQPIVPLESGPVRMYTCGPTVYRYAHVGNLRSYLLADLIRRVLLHHGLAVRHIKNITDVGHLRDERFDRGEDRMLVQAGLEDRTSAEIADAYEAAFHDDEAAVNILPAHVFPRATEHIPEMVALAERLQDLGFAYASDARNVYYDVSALDGYGSLSGNSLDDLRAGHRGEIEADKDDPADFALWKAAGEGRALKWDTPRWGEGSPGWHLECSAMAMRYLGDRFDLHTGGIDNVFPHHEDEIAQSSPLVGGPPARVWVHGEHLLMAGRKMAKSAGNFQRVTELAERGIDPLAFRYLVLTSKYGRKLNYSDTSLEAAAAGLRSLRTRLTALGPAPTDGPWAAPPPLRAGTAGPRPIGEATGIAGFGGDGGPAGSVALTDRAHRPVAPLSVGGLGLHARFAAAIDDDLDLPSALAVVREMVRADGLSTDERRWLVLDADAVLGLDLDRLWGGGGAAAPADVAAGGPDALPDDVRALLDARSAAREARDFAEADAIRGRIEALGWSVVDGPAGSTAQRVD